jgi:hypothetical protein
VSATEGKSALTEWAQRQGETDDCRGPRGSKPFDQDRMEEGPRGFEGVRAVRLRSDRGGGPSRSIKIGRRGVRGVSEGVRAI